MVVVRDKPTPILWCAQHMKPELECCLFKGWSLPFEHSLNQNIEQNQHFNNQFVC